MAYKVELFGELTPLNKQDFVKINDSLSSRYVLETDPGKRRGIGEALYRVNKPLFRAWLIRDPNDREDFDQEAFLYTMAALDSYRPGKGSFVSWLRLHVLQARASHAEKLGQASKVREAATIQASEGQPPPPEGDPLFWQSLRGFLSAPEWRLLSLRVFDGKSWDEVGEAVGIQGPTVRRRIMLIFYKVRLFLAKNGEIASKSPTPRLHNRVLCEQPADFAGSWVTKATFAARLGISPSYLAMMLAPGIDARRCPWMIDPRDVVKVQGIRVRYLEDARGLVYPRLVRRARATPPTPEGIPGKATGGGSGQRTGGPHPPPPHHITHLGLSGTWFSLEGPEAQLPPPIEGRRPRGRPRKNPPLPEGG